MDFQDSTAFTHYIAAGSPWTPATVLRRLALNEDVKIRRRVAENPNIPEDIINYLLRDAEPEVRIALTENPAVVEDYAEVLLRDPSPDVRYAVAENAGTSGETLLRLAADENPYVATRARRTYQRLYPHAVQEMTKLDVFPMTFSLVREVS